MMILLMPVAFAYTINDIGSWNVTSNFNKETNDIDVQLTLKASRNSYGDNHGVYFIARCKDKKTDVYILWNELIDDSEVEYKLDDNEPLKGLWSKSTDREATFYYSYLLNEEFLQTLFGAKTLSATIVPYNEIPLSVSFNMSGLEVAIIPLRKACAWTDRDLRIEEKKAKRAAAHEKKWKKLRVYWASRSTKEM